MKLNYHENWIVDVEILSISPYLLNDLYVCTDMYVCNCISLHVTYHNYSVRIPLLAQLKSEKITELHGKLLVT